MVMAKRNYKCYADYGLVPELLARKLTVLDTGAGPNVIPKDELPPPYMEKMRTGTSLNIRDANRTPIPIAGTIDLVVRIGSRITRVAFLVCERLAAGVVLGCDFMDRFAEAVYPRRKTIELDDGSSVSITRRPLRRPPTAPPLPASQEFAKAGSRTSPRVSVTWPFVLEPGTQTFVTVTSSGTASWFCSRMKNSIQGVKLSPLMAWCKSRPIASSACSLPTSALLLISSLRAKRSALCCRI